MSRSCHAGDRHARPAAGGLSWPCVAFAGVAFPAPWAGVPLVPLGRVAAFTSCRCGSAFPAAVLPGSASGHPAPILIKAAARVGRCALRAALLDRVGAGRAYQWGRCLPCWGLCEAQRAEHRPQHCPARRRMTAPLRGPEFLFTLLGAR